MSDYLPNFQRVDLNRKEINVPEEKFSQKKNSTFQNPQYYKVALSGENESSQKLHNLLSRYLTSQDPKDRSVFRQQLITAYWEFFNSLAPKMSLPSTPNEKRMAMRYGVILPTLFTEEQKAMFASAFVENTYNEPVYYVDEWFRDLGTGTLTLSATDEARPQKKNLTGEEETKRLMQLQAKNSGKLQTSENQLTLKESERAMLEAEVSSRVQQLCEHHPIPGMEPHVYAYTEPQKKLFNDIIDRLRSLSKVDKEIATLLTEFTSAKQINDSLQSKIDAGPAAVEISSTDISTEAGTVRQMAKMTCGRQGNHFPIYTKEYFHCTPRLTGFRENVLEQLKWVESIDPGAFIRTHKNVPNRIVPYVLLLPTYGDSGFCWEPFDRYNRVTSRGRIIVPMYPKNLQIAVLTAVADLRWQTAKEQASFYWMEEGLTGHYYEWFSNQKLKGDVKEYFINDYVLWMTKESEGMQKMDKEVRGIFWRFVPFPQDLKDKLKLRSTIYQELYQKDQNRAMSDGY
ncbi:MAG: hypothetical protein KBT02_07020 [Treponema sp.]|nr:hypothetical protein [Candidatus Treponema caballi]